MPGRGGRELEGKEQKKISVYWERQITTRIIKSFKLEGTLKGQLFQLPFSEQEHLQLHHGARAVFFLYCG